MPEATARWSKSALALWGDGVDQAPAGHPGPGGGSGTPRRADGV
ncbi:hypothetical protein [Streptomyces sp. NPDC060198]